MAKIDFKAFWEKDLSEAGSTHDIDKGMVLSTDELYELARDMVNCKFLTHINNVILNCVLGMNADPKLTLGAAYAFVFEMGMKYERERSEAGNLEKMLGLK